MKGDNGVLTGEVISSLYTAKIYRSVTAHDSVILSLCNMSFKVPSEWLVLHFEVKQLSCSEKGTQGGLSIQL